jgi:hypothetical protein
MSSIELQPLVYILVAVLALGGVARVLEWAVARRMR